MDFFETEWYKKWKSEVHFSEKEYLKEIKPPFEEVGKELKIISEKLLELLPDPSIGPEERIERLARVVPSSIMESKNMLTARSKLKNITRRLDELVYDNNMSNLEKIDFLVEIANRKAPHLETLVEKLEYIDDFRRTDNGRRF